MNWIKECGAGTAYPYRASKVIPLGLSGVRVTRSLVFCAMFCRSLFVLLYFFFWPLCCVPFFDLLLLITQLVSSDYTIGIFWLHNWYLLITLLVSSDYTIGIFWLHNWYILITQLVTSNFSCNPNTYRNDANWIHSKAISEKFVSPTRTISKIAAY
jgi:hypothetical protein